MRNIILVLTVVVVSASAGATSAKNTASATTKSKATKAPKKKLTQEANFTGATVNGKYQIAGGAVSAVENEKTLNDIVGGRKDFKDRLKQDLAKAKPQNKQVAE